MLELVLVGTVEVVVVVKVWEFGLEMMDLGQIDMVADHAHLPVEWHCLLCSSLGNHGYLCDGSNNELDQ